ncbi:MAG: O-antigen ligase family protein [Ignavibacteriae bacterium]|nr:O-antigen ligase family protein [Ignavibacteriota bacterium]
MMIPAYILFFLMLSVPTSYKLVKAVLSVVVLGQIICEAVVNRRLSLYQPILLWSILMSIVGLGFIIFGSMHGAIGDIRVAQVFFMYPLVYMVFVAGAAKAKLIGGLFKVLVVAMFGIALHSLSYIFHAAGWLPDAFYIDLDIGEEPVLGIYGGTVEYYLLSIPTLFFLVPFLLAALLSWQKQSSMPVRRSWLWLAFILSVVLVLLSGRRGLWVVFFLAPLITFFWRLFLSGEQRRAHYKLAVRTLFVCAIGLVGVFVYLQTLFGLDTSVMADFFISGFDSQHEESANIRTEQFSALLQGWSENPLFGVGHGVTHFRVVRSQEVPWAYELSYLALLFHTGIIGFCIYAAGIVWIFLMGLRILRSGGVISLYMFPVLVGMTCFLIANATNPYLEKYDFMWVIFLPVALINFWLLNGGKGWKSHVNLI